MDEYLYHHGIKGQKWGIRRFQNQDGSLTSEGKRRLGKASDTVVNAGKKTARAVSNVGKRAVDNQKQYRQEKRTRRTISDAELQKRLNRMQNEKKLHQLTDSELYPGRAFVKGVMSDVGKRALTTAVTGASLYMVKAAFTKSFDPVDLGKAMFNGGPKRN